MLRTEPDLHALHQDPQFAAFCAYCDQQLAQRQPNTRATLTVLAPPSGPLEQWPVLLVLHGNLSTAQATLPQWHGALTQGWGLAVLQSSQLAGPDMYVWNDLDQALSDVTEHWNALSSHYPLDPQRIVVGGFSRGAGVALVATLRHWVPARGVIAVSPAIPQLDQLAEALASATCAGYLVVGQEDATSLQQCHKVVALTEHAPKPWIMHIVPQIGHEYPTQMASCLEAALAFVG
jgi:predicted esterase